MTMQAGVDLFDQYGLDLTRQQCHASVVDLGRQDVSKGNKSGGKEVVRACPTRLARVGQAPTGQGVFTEWIK